MSEITLQSLKAQLDRIELKLSRMNVGTFSPTAPEHESESFKVVMMGGVDALKALNRKRAAEQRRKKR